MMAKKPTYQELKKRIQELERKEETLRESEKRYRQTFHTSPDAINLNRLDDGLYIDSNAGFTRIMGYTPEEVIGKTSLSLNIWDNPEDRARLVDGLMKKGYVDGMEARFVGKDGKIRDGLMSARITNISGEKVIVSITRDITQRKQRENALRVSEEKYRKLVETAQDIVFTLNKNGNFTYLNPEFTNITGFPAQDFMGCHFTEILAPEYIESTIDRFKRGLSGETIPIYEVELQHKDGKTIPVELKVTSFLDPEGKTIGRIGLARDISERKKVVESLRESEEKFRSLFNFSPQAIALTEVTTGRLLDVNNMFCELTKYNGKDIVGRNTTELGFYSDRDRKRFTTALETSGEVNGLEMNFKTKDGSITALMFARGMQLAGKPSIVTLFMDITERKHLETQLQQAQKIEAIGTLAGGIAHDFNNILFGIFGYLEMAMDDIPENDPLRRYLNAVLKGAGRAKDLVRQILTFSRQSDQELKPLKAQLVIKEALKLLRASLPSTIEINRDIDKDCGLVLADPTQIHQLVMNLCTNAYHAMEQTGGKLKVTLKEVEWAIEDVKDPSMAPGPHACLTVTDTGLGMEEGVMAKIFDPYFTTKEKGKGTGLGLAVIHGIVKSHGGHINVYSESGKGAEFRVYLPVIREKPGPDQVATGSPIQKGTERILLVDDEAFIADMEKQMLERLGYQITSRTSSPDALEAFQTQPDKFDLVITDLTMPNMTGDKLAGELRKIRPDIPILLCSGFSEQMSKEKAASLGIKGFLMKPLVIRDLSKMIRRVLTQIPGKS